MGKWTKIRWVLRGLAAGATAAAAATPVGWATLLLLGVAGTFGAMAMDLPRDHWSPEQRKEKLPTPPAQPFIDE